MGKNRFSLNKKPKTPGKNPKKSLESSSSGGSPSTHFSTSSLFHRIQDSDELRQVFDKFDANGDGKISSSELKSMLQCLGSAGSSEEVQSMMTAADLDGDGYISFEEFVSVNTTECDSAKCIEDLRNAFAVYDRDRNGVISAEELHYVLRGMGEKMSLTDCKSMIKGVDRNGDGAVNFEEFMEMMTRSCA